MKKKTIYITLLQLYSEYSFNVNDTILISINDQIYMYNIRIFTTVVFIELMHNQEKKYYNHFTTDKERYLL